MSDAPNAMVRPSRLPKVATPAAVATRMPEERGDAQERAGRDHVDVALHAALRRHREAVRTGLLEPQVGSVAPDDLAPGGVEVVQQTRLGARVEGAGGRAGEHDREAPVGGDELSALDAQRRLARAEPLEDPLEGGQGIGHGEPLEKARSGRGEPVPERARLVAQRCLGQQQRYLALRVARQEVVSAREVQGVDVLEVGLVERRAHPLDLRMVP
jgi:hypothetical protein